MPYIVTEKNHFEKILKKNMSRDENSLLSNKSYLLQVDV